MYVLFNRKSEEQEEDSFPTCLSDFFLQITESAILCIFDVLLSEVCVLIPRL